MKIAILTELFHPHIAGCERRFLEVGKRLSNRGHEIHVFTIQYKKGLPKEEIVDGIFIHRCAYINKYIVSDGYRSLMGVLKYSLAAIFKVIGSDFDVYYSNQWPILHSIFTNPFASPLAQEWCEVWFKNIKMIILEKMLKRVTSYHVAVSEFTKRRLVEFLHIEQRKIAVIPNGVDYRKFSGGAHKKKWGKLVYVGRMVPHKHVDLLINAFRQVKHKMPETELHVVGSGPLLPSIKELAHKVDGVYVHGNLSEDHMLDILKESCIFVLPSEREGSGIVALEAMAAGTPVITVDFPDNAAKELINRKNGLVVPPMADSIAEAALSLLSDESRWHEISRCACAFAKQYDWDFIANKMERYLKDVAKGSL